MKMNPKLPEAFVSRMERQLGKELPAFLRALEEAGIKADYVAGCSMGSIVGAAYAAGVDMDTMEKALCSMTIGKLAAFTCKAGGLCSTRKMRKILLKYIKLFLNFRCRLLLHF